MTMRLLPIRLECEQDAIVARRRARELAAALGLSPLDQARIASAVLEISCNALDYAGGGEVTFVIDDTTHPHALRIEVRDWGPGIRDLQAVLEGIGGAQAGMRTGVAGARCLIGHFSIQSRDGDGTLVTMVDSLPADRAAVSVDVASQLMHELAPAVAQTEAFDELRQLNRELVSTLAEFGQRQQDLLRLTQELEATNRGVVALYGELDERAEELRRADAMKTRFLSNMSHELRTPLSSIRALAKLLLNRLDGDLTGEQERQVTLILSAAEHLAEMVNDLLDLAKIEAGKTDVVPVWFDAAGLFAALRAMLAPLLNTPHVQLEFASVAGLPKLYTDEPKLTQILRNFVSNALKYTEHGRIEVGARMEPDGDRVTFFVSDTGIGIAPEHHQIIFEEFSQVQNRLQQRTKGTGLGLPLCRKLAMLLGGDVRVCSELGAGSTFYVTVPVCLVQAGEAPHAAAGTMHMHGSSGGQAA
ncbi:sensor histidine kinase [Mycetohabitans sp. B8]|nr:sensor histidine kinase [Mycetohabitans sp. B8]